MIYTGITTESFLGKHPSDTKDAIIPRASATKALSNYYLLSDNLITLNIMLEKLKPVKNEWHRL
jgi:hypothetical protein